MGKDDNFFQKRSLDDAISFLEKRGAKSISRSQDREERQLKRVPLDMIRLDNELNGGVARGRIIEIFGPEGSGKSTLALEIAKHVQKQKQKNMVICLDFEHAMDIDYIENIGVSIEEDKWRILEPDTLEEGFDIAGVLASTERIGAIIFDSVAAMTPHDELVTSMNANTVGLQARQMGKAFRKIVGLLERTQTIGIFINQVREGIGVRFGNPETTPGGKALKFYASLRFRASQKKWEEDANSIISKIKIVKNKTSEHQQGVLEYVITASKGYRRDIEMLWLAEEFGYISSNRKRYTFDNDDKKYTRDEILKELSVNEKHKTSIITYMKQRKSKKLESVQEIEEAMYGDKESELEEKDLTSN